MAALVFRSALLDLLRARSDDIARRVAQRLEVHQVTEPMMSIVGARRPAPMVAAILPLISEALEGGSEVRQTYLEMIVPSAAQEAEATVLVHEGYRIWMYVLTELVGRLPGDFQGPASAWLANFMTDWMRAVEEIAVRSRAVATPTTP